jgi:beta-1,4-mannosyltransferase
VLAWPAFGKQAANPHAALLTRELIALGAQVVDWTPLRALLRPGDLWHLHHPDIALYRRSFAGSIFETVAFLSLLWLARLRGLRVLWTIHDLGSNDGLHPRLETWFWKAFVPTVDAVICLSERGRVMAHERFPGLVGRPTYVVPHGHYRDAYPQTMTREAARRRLGLAPETSVLLHFGLMRPYKNVPHLIRTFRALADPSQVLLIVGRPFDAILEREVRAAADGAPNVRFDLRWIPPDDVQTFFVASDLVVLPYRRILNSGALMLAMTFGRPVLVPDLGAMRDQQAKFGPEWVRLYRGGLGPEELSAACAWARGSRAQSPDLSGGDWAEIALQTCAIYAALLSHPPGRPASKRTARGRTWIVV